MLDIITWNRAAISKLLWDVEQKKDKLWVLWIHTFYIKTNDLSTMNTPKQASWLIRKIFDAREWSQNLRQKRSYSIKKECLNDTTIPSNQMEELASGEGDVA